MLHDLDSPGDAPDLAADVCIAGAGAAGVTLARALAREHVSVLLLESGGRDYRVGAQDLAEGERAPESQPYYPLRESRLRFFGGTTAIWGGRVAELDPIDFERRPGIAHTGWPLSHADLVPWYEAAHRALGLERIASAEEGWRRLGLDRPPVDPERLAPGFWQFDDRSDRFTLAAADDLVAARGVRIVLNATVTRIRLAPGGASVAGFELRSLRGASAVARARHFVLATGGIEAPRLVLASRDGETGFGGDTVGRFFMEHPHARGGTLVTPDAGPGLARALALLPRDARHRGARQAAVLRPAEALQAREGILNSALTLALRPPEGAAPDPARRAYAALRHALPATGTWRSAWRAAKRGAAAWRRITDPALTGLSVASGRRVLALSVRAEQAPDPQSRITLSPDRRDALGVPLPVLDWRLGETDRRSVARLVELVGEEAARLGLGRVEPARWLAEDQAWRFDDTVSNHPFGGYHHMGTLRMAASPREGVVDADCRFHDVANLHVAGSAVFPTGGWANPTLTIVALSLRLAGRLARLVARDLALASGGGPRNDDAADHTRPAAPGAARSTRNENRQEELRT